MRQVNDNPIDPLSGSLGPAVKPKATPKPDPVREFERATDRKELGDHSKALEAIAETIRKQITPGDAEEWQGCDWTAAYVAEIQAWAATHFSCK